LGKLLLPYCCHSPDTTTGGSQFLWILQAKKRADERTRTADLLITSELLYQLSYVGLVRAQSISQGYAAFTHIRIDAKMGRA
jgi:hypothetical protein